MQKVWLYSIALFFFSANADIGNGILSRYLNPIFVNTGIGAGMNFAQALRAGFRTIHLIDTNEMLVNHCRQIAPRRIAYHNTHRNLEKYTVNLLDSGKELNNVIDTIEQPITFLLGTCIPEYREYTNNVLQELEHIKKHKINTHTILIDYIHHEGKPSFENVTLDSIKEKLLEINYKYKFKFEKGGYLGKELNAVFVAYLT